MQYSIKFDIQWLGTQRQQMKFIQNKLQIAYVKTATYLTGRFILTDQLPITLQQQLRSF